MKHDPSGYYATMGLLIKKGEEEGHPFRGNQWTEGQGSGGTGKWGSEVNFSKLDSAIKGFSSFKEFSATRDKAAYVEKAVKEMLSATGIKAKVVMAGEKEFNSRFQNAKVSAFATVESIKAGYLSKANEIWLRKERINKMTEGNEYRLFRNVVYHEMGHAAHANLLGVTAQDKGAYGAGWAEEFANRYSEVLGGRDWNHNVLARSTEMYPGQREAALRHDFPKSYREGFRELLNELKQRRSRNS